MIARLKTLNRMSLYNRLLTSHLGYLVFGRFVPSTIFALILSAKAAGLFAWFSVRDDRASIGFLSMLAYQVLVLIFLATVCLLFVIRHPVKARAAKLSTMLLALSGTFVSTPLAFAEVTVRETSVVLLGVSLMLLGMVVAVFALMRLGRCFGISPQARGLVVTGPYRWIRHPLYLGEQISTLGLLLPVINPLTGIVFLVHCLIQYSRALSEEQLLSATFPQYGGYARRTARFIPRLF